MDMEQEITQYLKKKFCDAIEKHVEEDEKKEENLPSSILSPKEKCWNGFKGIKKLLEDPSYYKGTEIREFLYSLDDVWTVYQITSKANLITLDRLRRELNGIKTQLELLNKKNEGTPPSADTATPSGEEVAYGPRFPSVDASDLKVHGFDDEVISQQKVLLKGSDDGLKAIAIVGMAGVGKTALCQSLLSKIEVKEHFFPRIWVRMPRQRGTDEQRKKEETLRSMLASLGVEKKIVDEVHEELKVDEARKELNLKGLLYAVSRQLQGKRYLVVLDDARYPQDWYEKLKSVSPPHEEWTRLADALPKDSGGAVIVTSRKEELAKAMVGEKGIHHVQPLVDPDHCWLIYQEAADTTIDKLGPSINEKILKEELQRRCAGHPLTAKLMGDMTYKARG